MQETPRSLRLSRTALFLQSDAGVNTKLTISQMDRKGSAVCLHQIAPDRLVQNDHAIRFQSGPKKGACTSLVQ